MPTLFPSPSRRFRLVGVDATEESSADERWFTPENFKSWATSTTLHTVLLLIMGLWYFAPKSKPAVVIDSRLMGSEMGVDDGLTATGGLSTEIELVATPNPPAEPTSILPSMNLESSPAEADWHRRRVEVERWRRHRESEPRRWKR